MQILFNNDVETFAEYIWDKELCKPNWDLICMKYYKS